MVTSPFPSTVIVLWAGSSSKSKILRKHIEKAYGSRFAPHRFFLSFTAQSSICASCGRHARIGRLDRPLDDSSVSFKRRRITMLVLSRKPGQKVHVGNDVI